MTDQATTQRIEPATDEYGNLYRPPVQASVKRARGSAGWGERCKAALFVLLLLAIANLAAFDVLIWHHYRGFR